MIRDLAEQKKGELVNPTVILGQLANQAVALTAIQDYRERKAHNTIRRQDATLVLFENFVNTRLIELAALAEKPNDHFPPIHNLNMNPESWKGVTWGLVASFQKWLLNKGYSIATVNVKISTIKTYSKLSFKSGVLDANQFALIKAVEGYSRTEGKRIDEERPESRIGSKKAEAVSISLEQAKVLKNQPETAQGKRDRLLLCLLLDHGLRVGEITFLKVEDFDPQAGTFTFYRPKVDKVQTHQMTNDTWRSLEDYLEITKRDTGLLILGSVKGGNLSDNPMSTRAINKRVGYLAKKAGIEGLSPHDCRHFWASQAARSGTPIEKLREAGGWSSLAMPARYIQAAAIANQGVKLE